MLRFVLGARTPSPRFHISVFAAEPSLYHTVHLRAGTSTTVDDSGCTACGAGTFAATNNEECASKAHTAANCDASRLPPGTSTTAISTTPKVVLEWKSTTTTTPGWTLDESKSDKSEVDQSIWPKFETKKDPSSHPNYDLLLFPAGTYTLVQ